VVYQVTLSNEVYRTHALKLLSSSTHSTRGSEAFIDGSLDSSGAVKDDLGRRLKWRAALDALESWKKEKSERSRETVDRLCQHLEEAEDNGGNSIQNESAPPPWSQLIGGSERCAMLDCSRQAAVKVGRG
jgi:hypothetical protein